MGFGRITKIYGSRRVGSKEDDTTHPFLPRGAKNASVPRGDKEHIFSAAKPRRQWEPSCGGGLRHLENRRTRAWSMILGRSGQRNWNVAQCTCREQVATRADDSQVVRFLLSLFHQRVRLKSDSEPLPLCEEFLWPFLDAWDIVRLRATSSQWNVPGRYGPHGELFFLLWKKEPRVFSELVLFGPSIPVETVQACALIGLHMLAEENAWRSDSGFSASSSSSCEDNVDNDALCVIGLHGSGDTIALFLQDWEVAKIVPGNA